MGIYLFDAWPLCIKTGIHNSAIFFHLSMEIFLELNFDPPLNFQFFVSRIFSNTIWGGGGRNGVGRSYLEIFCELCIEILRLERRKSGVVRMKILGSRRFLVVSSFPSPLIHQLWSNSRYFVIYGIISIYEIKNLSRSKDCRV